MRTVALASVLALVTACAVNQVIGLVAYVPRPFVIGLGHTLIEHWPARPSLATTRRCSSRMRPCLPCSAGAGWR